MAIWRRTGRLHQSLTRDPRLIGVLCAAALIGCGPPASPPAVRGSATLPVPTGSVDGIARVGKSVVVGVLNAGSHAFEVWVVDEDGSNLRQLAFPADPLCQRTDYLYPREFGRDGVSVTKACSVPPPVMGFSASYSAAQLTLVDGGVKVISAPQHDHNPGAISWDPVGRKGIAATGDGSCETLIWVTDSGVQPVEMTLTAGNLTWNLASAFQDTWDAQGLAAWPAWSPDGLTIAFVASLDAIGHHGLDRARQPWTLYTMDPSTLSPRVIATGLGQPRDLHWASDGNHLAFSGSIRSGEAGTWTTTLDGRMSRVTSDQARYLTWGSDGSTLLMAVPHPSAGVPDADEMQLVRF
jgi:dipeptidyl aminopeptidase/acylaminoacyl peptidase